MKYMRNNNSCYEAIGIMDSYTYKSKKLFLSK